MVFIKTIDVIMCTYNSNKPYFQKCLESVKSEIPIHHFIVVDKFSVDGTVDMIRRYFPHAIIIKSNADLALARKLGIENVDTEYFAFIDDDVEMPPGWFSRLLNKLEEHVGAIHEHFYSVFKGSEVEDKWYQWCRKRYRFQIPCGTVVDVGPSTKEKIVGYGYAHSTIIMTKLVRDWHPPTIVSAGEDWLLERHIVGKGYIWRILWNFNTKHFSPTSFGEYCRKIRWRAAGGRVVGYSTSGTFRLLFESILLCLEAFFASVEQKEPRILKFIMLSRLNYLAGYLGWEKYITMRR